MQTLKFIFDIDGVACAHAFSICNWVNQEYGLNSKYEDVVTWDHDFGPINFVEAVNRCYSDPDFILNMDEHEGFKELLLEISSKMEVCFATNRKSMHAETIEWIRKKFGNYEVSFVKDKSILNFNFLLDDYPQTILDLGGKDKIGILIQRPWNDNQKIVDEVDKYSNLFFVSKYKYIHDIISDIEKV